MAKLAGIRQAVAALLKSVGIHVRGYEHNFEPNRELRDFMDLQKNSLEMFIWKLLKVQMQLV